MGDVERYEYLRPVRQGGGDSRTPTGLPQPALPSIQARTRIGSDIKSAMGEGDVDVVRRIYGFDWAAVGSRSKGFSELAGLVSGGFTAQLSPELGERMMEGVGALRDFTQALEADFSEFRYDADEFLPGADGTVVVLGTIQASGRASRMPLGGEFGHVWTIQNGKAAEVRAYRDRQTAKQQVGL